MYMNHTKPHKITQIQRHTSPCHPYTPLPVPQYTPLYFTTTAKICELIINLTVTILIKCWYVLITDNGNSKTQPIKTTTECDAEKPAEKIPEK